jgi:hypothetical protein
MLKPLVVDKTNLTPFDQPYDKRECPTLTSVVGQCVNASLRTQVSPVGMIAAVSTINMMLFSGARVRCTTPFGTTKP